MNFKSRINRWAQCLVVALLLAVAAGCANPVQAVNAAQYHAFGFDARQDSPDTEILAYRYGSVNIGQLRMPYWKDEKEGSRQATGIHATMSIEGGLYVKWRLRSTGQVFEDTVDLRVVLPNDYRNQWVYFVAKGPQLFVYRVETIPRPADWPAIGPRKFQHEKVHQIYPIAR